VFSAPGGNFLQVINNNEQLTSERRAKDLQLHERIPSGDHRSLQHEVKVHEQESAKLNSFQGRDRFNIFMNKFRRVGCIKYNGGLKIHNSVLSIVLQDQNNQGFGLLELAIVGATSRPERV